MVLHSSAESGEHPASLCAVRYRGFCRFVLAVVAVVRHRISLPVVYRQHDKYSAFVMLSLCTSFGARCIAASL